MCLPALSGHYPGANLPRGIVTYVLRMSALQVGHPVSFVILMEVYNASLHEIPQAEWQKWVRGKSRLASTMNVQRASSSR